MIRFFRAFILALAHPIQAQDYYFNNIPYRGYEDEDLKLKFSEAILCAWTFNIIKALISIILYIFLANILSDSIPDSFSTLKSSLPAKLMTPNSLFVFSLAQNMILFPVIAIFSIKISILCIRLFGFILGENANEENINKVFIISLSSHVFSTVPVIGTVFQKVTYLIYCFLGIKKLLNCSGWIAFIVLIFPYVLLMLFLMMLVLLLMNLIA